MTAGLIFALGCAILAILYGIWQSARILRLPAGNERMQEIAAAVREGANAYLRRQYTTIAVVGVILFLIIGFIPQLGWATASRLMALAGQVKESAALLVGQLEIEVLHFLRPYPNSAFSVPPGHLARRTNSKSRPFHRP